MYRFLLRPTWIGFHLLVVAAIVAMINLGLWQLRRLDERRAFNAVIEARYDAPPVPFDDLLDDPLDESIEWRPTTLSGTYLADEQLLVVNRSQNGRAGSNVAVPMRLDDGRIVIVNRGFVPLVAEDRIPPVADGEVEVLGRVRLGEERRRGQLSDPTDGELTEVQRIDIERLSPQLPGEVVPVYIELIESNPPEQPGLPEPVIAPDLSEGNHLSYAVQWFIFSIAVAAGWVLAVRRSAANRRRAADTDRESNPDREPVAG